MQQAADNLRAFRDRAMRAGPAAAEAMARQGRQLDREMLTLSAHAPGTRSPSPPGAPPSMITGRLMESVWAGTAEPGPGEYSWTAHAGPGATAASANGPYGRFLQFGGDHVAHNSSGLMHWFEGGTWHHAVALSKDSRDYLRRAVEAGTADGSLHDAAVQGFRDAMDL